MNVTGAVVALLAFAVLVPGAGPVRAGEVPGDPAPPQVSGRAVYEGKGNCATCHGREGAGTPLAPALNDGDWLHIGGSLEEIIAVVRAGVPKPKQHPAAMPPMGGAKLKEAEVRAAAEYVHELSHPTVAALRQP